MDANDRTLPLSEDFHSLQGEGQWVGTPMHFIRTAGCSVGENPRTSGNVNVYEPIMQGELPVLKTGAGAWLCHTYDGRGFFCDTDFNKHSSTSFSQLLDDTWENHICITGGEPLIHIDKLNEFFIEASERGKHIHLETSGTILMNEWYDDLWISVSPKQGVLDEMIDFADEIKLLVDQDFNWDYVPQSIRAHTNVYVQPVNDELMVRRDNYEKCMEVLRVFPRWKLSVQLHKFLNIR